MRTAGATGTMTDYNELLNPTSPVQSVNGQTGNVSLITSNISEGTNLYYTSARVTAAGVGGDVSGTVGSASVIKLQGKAVSSASPATGQVLKFDGTQWGSRARPARTLSRSKARR
jgi:trimeric autotransporter adhesin